VIVFTDRTSRAEVHRHRVYNISRTCAVCNGYNLTPSGRNRYLFKYVVVPQGDRERAAVLPHLVCSDPCHRVAHEEEIAIVQSKKSA
jgi:hypothetical protein